MTGDEIFGPGGSTCIVHRCHARLYRNTLLIVAGCPLCTTFQNQQMHKLARREVYIVGPSYNKSGKRSNIWKLQTPYDPICPGNFLQATPVKRGAKNSFSNRRHI
jgi:hypothetical protein